MNLALNYVPFSESIPVDLNGSLTEIQLVIKRMISTVESIDVQDDSSYKEMTSIYADARQWQKKVEAQRKELIEPFRKREAAINDRAKTLTLPLGHIIHIANSKVNKYAEMLEEIKKKKEEQLKQEAAVFDVDPNELYIPEEKENLVGDGASIVIRTEKRYHVKDLKQVPEQYLEINEKAIKNALKLGVLEIPGLEIYEEKTTTLRTK